MAERPRIVFMGTPAFASNILEGMLQADWNVVAVYTQPDRQSGRGLELKKSPVKELAEKAGLPVYQPHNFRAREEVENLRKLAPDFLVVASYGLILPQAVLDIPAIAPLNIHASLLPRYRGAAPIQRAIQDSWHGNEQSGISLMRMVKDLDAGPVYAMREVSLAGATAASLTVDLAKAGQLLLLESLPEIAAGKLTAVEQDHGLATYAAKLTREDGIIDWHKSAPEIDAQIRAMNPWPGCRTVFELNGRSVPVLIRAGSATAEPGAVGELRSSKAGLFAGCGTGSLRIDMLQPEGGKAVSAKDFVNGRRLAAGIIGRAH